jgi:hypothetical protein
VANKDIVNGFSPFGRIYQCNEYLAESICYPGDLLKKNGAGTVEPAAAADACVGVAMNYSAAAGKVLVADHPDQLFVGQVAGSEVDAQTDLGLNCSAIVAAGNSTYRRSGMEIDGSTLATTATLELKLIRILPAVDNALGANAKCVVRINNHQNGSGTGVAGV